MTAKSPLTSASLPNPMLSNTHRKSFIESIIANEINTTIDVSGFAKGMYFVKVKNENDIVLKKFIKE